MQPEQQAGGPRAGRPAVGDVLIAAGGLMIFLFSFAPFVAYDPALVTAAKGDSDFDGRFSAWSAQTFMAPLTWFVVVAALLLVVLAAVRVLRGGDPAALGISTVQAQLGLALFGFFVLLGYALAAKDMMFGLDQVDSEVKSLFDFPLTFAWGGILMLVGGVLALGGALLNHFGVNPLAGRARTGPAQPYQQPTYPPPVEFHQQRTDQPAPQQQPYPPPVQFHEQSPEA